jgi:hypothetical protein
MSESSLESSNSPLPTIVYVPDPFSYTLSEEKHGQFAGERPDAEGAEIAAKIVMYSRGRSRARTFRPRPDVLPSRIAPSHISSNIAAEDGEQPQISEEEAESHYQALGDWKGPKADRGAARRYWLSQGVNGACWLVRRLRTETDVETLHAAGSLLADLGEIGVGPIMEELGDSLVVDQSLALLKALAWLGESHDHPTVEGAQAELILAHCLQDDDSDMREAAAGAMRLLPPERAIRWLNPRLRVETNEDVKRAIQDVLISYSAAGT